MLSFLFRLCMEYREHGWRVTVEITWQGGSEGQEEGKKASRAIKVISTPLRPGTQASNMELMPRIYKQLSCQFIPSPKGLVNMV